MSWTTTRNDRIAQLPTGRKAMEIPRDHGKLREGSPARRRDAIEYRLMVLLTYPFFVLAALASRVWPGRRYFSSTAVVRRGSVFKEAKTLANSTIPYAFMGW